MPESDSWIRRVRVVHVRSKDYHVAHVTGANGGITPGGELFVQLYEDGLSDPADIDAEVPEGQTSISLNTVPEVVVGIRTLQFAMTITKDQARKLGQWLVAMSDADRAELLEMARGVSKDE